MDELTIGDKIYISSKRAAKITGYAKDYVGQLCREGRVEARLVGRNWYVLEPSIQEHRFGKENEEIGNTSEAPKSNVEKSWVPSRYVTGNALPVIPTVEERPRSTVFDIQKEEIRPDAVADMQSAWREWFEKKNVSVSEAEDETQVANDGEEESIVTEESLEELVAEPEISLKREPETESYEQEIEQQESVSIRRTYVRSRESEQEGTRLIPEPVAVKKNRVGKSRRGKGVSNVIMRSLLISIAGLAVIIAIVGVNVDRIPAHGVVQQQVLNFLGGVSIYKNTLK